MDELERRYVTAKQLMAEQRADGAPVISGYAAVFNVLSVVLWGFREKIAPGAFSDSLADDVRALWNHDTNIVMGRTKSGTLRLAEDTTGLRIENDPPSSAEREIESIRRGDVDQMSFGFRTLEDEWDEDSEGQIVRTLRKVKLYEVSFVAFPAYPATSVALRGEGATVDQAYGLIPALPKQFRRASDVVIPADLARARRKRHLQLLSVE